jgi:hypothetical protein
MILFSNLFWLGAGALAFVLGGWMWLAFAGIAYFTVGTVTAVVLKAAA